MIPDDATTQSRQHALEATNAQLLAYARDLKRALGAEREKDAALNAATRQMLQFAQDLNAAYRSQQQKTGELERAYYDTVRRLLRASHYKDRDTGTHNRRLSHYARVLALELGWTKDDADLLFSATPMHDIGKIGVPDAILFKPGPLSEEEWRVLKRHCAFGAALLAGSTSPLLQMGRLIALCHHEKWDGSGYPRGLAGDKIPRCAQIVAIADHYDALRSLRPYKAPMPHVTAVAIVLYGDGRTRPEHFDPEVLERFRDIHPRFEAVFARFEPARREP
jgi:putative two-component system response regulator